MQYQIFVDNEIQGFKKFTERNFGTVDPTSWKTLSEKTTSAYLDAPYPSKAFPLITGRLRAFSTTYTNEFLASNGYIICMINTPFLFFYNKLRFDSNESSQNFYQLKTAEKFLVLFNDSAQHHWDFATEGITAALFLNNRSKGRGDKSA